MKEPLSIVFLDDEAPLRDLASRLMPISFPKFDVTVKTGENGLVLAELVRTYKPQCIITDNNMPGMNGIEALAKLPKDIAGLVNADGQPYSIPKVLITSGKLDEAMNDSRIYGLKNITFLEKPYGLSDFLAAAKSTWPEYS